MHPGCQSQPERMWQLLQNLSIPTFRTIGKEILIRDVPTHETTISNPATRSEASKELNPAVRAVFTRNSPNPSTYCIGKRRRSLSQTRTGNTKGSVIGARCMDLLSPRIPHQSLYNPCAHVPSPQRSEEHTSELQSPCNLVCRLLLEKKKKKGPSRARRCRSAGDSVAAVGYRGPDARRPCAALAAAEPHCDPRALATYVRSCARQCQ